MTVLLWDDVNLCPTELRRCELSKRGDEEMRSSAVVETGCGEICLPDVGFRFCNILWQINFEPNLSFNVL